MTFLSAVEPLSLLEIIHQIEMADLQRGVATVTCMAICGAGETVLLRLGMNPESMPVASLSQGVVKADCVTVWFCDSKVNITMSPTAASMVSGV